MTSPDIRDIVEMVYTKHLQLPQDWTPTQRQDFIEAQAAKISYQVAERAGDGSAGGGRVDSQPRWAPQTT